MNPNKPVINVVVKNDLFILGVGSFKAGSYPAQQSIQPNYWTVEPVKGNAKDVLKTDCAVVEDVPVRSTSDKIHTVGFFLFLFGTPCIPLVMHLLGIN